MIELIFQNVIEELKKKEIIRRDSTSKKICDRHYTEDQLKKTTNGKKRLSNAREIPTENLATRKNEEILTMVCISTAFRFSDIVWFCFTYINNAFSIETNVICCHFSINIATARIFSSKRIHIYFLSYFSFQQLPNCAESEPEVVPELIVSIKWNCSYFRLLFVNHHLCSVMHSSGNSQIPVM